MLGFRGSTHMATLQLFSVSRLNRMDFFIYLDADLALKTYRCLMKLSMSVGLLT